MSSNNSAASPKSDWGEGKEPSNAELFAAIRRTQELAAAAGAINTEEIARRAVSAYWAQKDGPAGALTRDLERETALDLFTLASGLSEAQPRTGFWRDLALATLPVLTAIVTLAVPGQFGLLPPWELPVVGVTVSAVASVFLLYHSRQLDRGLAPLVALPGRRWRNSLGALAGGLIVAALVGVVSYEQTLRTASMKLTLAERRMADFAVSSLAAVHQGGRFIAAPRQQRIELVTLSGMLAPPSPTLSFSTDAANATEGIYRGNTAGVPGELVLRLDPVRGQLEWHKPGATEVRDRYAVGRVISKREHQIVLEASDGATLELEVGEVRDVALREGQCLIACFHPDTHVLREVHALAC